MTNEHVEFEFNDDVNERLDRFVEQRNGFPFHLTNPDPNAIVEHLLDTIERLDDKYERLSEQAELDRDVLFDAVLIAMQRDEGLQTVTAVKERLVYYVNIAFHLTGNFNAVDYEVRRLYDLADKHNKTRRYDNGVFQWLRR